MKFFDLFKYEENIYLDKKTFVVLRWIAISGQLFTLLIVNFILNLKLPIFFCSVIIFLGVVSNLYLQLKVLEKQLNNLKSSIFLFLDLTQLSILLFLTGGITNPFAILLIIPSIVSSTFLSLKSTINLIITTILFLAILMLSPFPIPSHDGNIHFHVPNYYLYAIPVAISIGLIFLSYFGIRFGTETRKRNEALNKLELVMAKEEYLETVGLQAAAAAHSLGTPLSTINVTVKELQKEIGKHSKYTKDIDLILSQTDRCKEILKKISQDDLAKDSFLNNVSLDELVNEIVRSFKTISTKKISILNNQNVIFPKIENTLEITYGLRNFIGNAVKYSDSLVEIKLESGDELTKIEICDDGPGFSSDIKNLLGEPYIKSKNEKVISKSGLGLGTFIGKTLLERMKAKVEFGKSIKTKGAMVSITWKTKSLLTI